MLQLEDHRKFLIENIYLNDLKKLNLETIQLKKTSTLNQYLYESKGFKILRWNFKPEINFLVFYKENHIFVETNESLIKGLGLFSDKITVKVNFNILKSPENSLIAERSVTLGFKKKPKFIKFISNKILKKLLSESLDIIAKRVDKKFLLKLSQVIQN